MTRRIVTVFLVLGLLITSSCATLKHDPPAGCENSIVYKYSPWSFVMLTGAVDGCYALNSSDPKTYELVKTAAEHAIILLTENKAATFENLTATAPDMALIITSQLAAIFPPEQVLDKCDREVLLGYLRMI